MKLSLRFAASSVVRPLVFGATLVVAPLAQAAPAAASTEASPLESKLGNVLGRPGGLTASAVAVRAENTSFDVKARREELESAAAGVDQALVGYFPRLNLTARYTRLSPIDQTSLGNLVVAPDTAAGQDPTGARLVAFPFSFPVILNQFVVQAALNVPLSDYLLRIPQAYAAATKNKNAAVFTEKATRLKTRADAKALYYTWVRAKLQEVVGEQALDQAKAHLVDAKHAFDAGTVSRADVLGIESQVASSELLLERMRNMTKLSEVQIRAAMHDPDSVSYEVGETVDAEISPPDASANLTAMWSEAKANRLEVRALDESAGSFREQAKNARAASYPKLDAFGDLYYSNPNQRVIPSQAGFATTWDVGLALSWSPNDLAAGRAQGKSFEARASNLVAQRESLEDGMRVEVTQASNSMSEARVAIQSTIEGLTASEESYRVRRSLFQNGRATSVELTDAETDLTRSRLEAINARVDLRIAQVRLQHALGRDANGGE